VIKRIRPDTKPIATQDWRDLDDAVEVELTSEDPECPIESALLGQDSSGWRAGNPGPQTIRLTWRNPITVRRIRLVFEEHSHGRTHEFVVRASASDGPHEIVRQQFTFSPPGTTVEREEYSVNLEGVARLELAIIPAIDDTNAFATLREWRIA
jgi:hypothetical protein